MVISIFGCRFIRQLIIAEFFLRPAFNNAFAISEKEQGESERERESDRVGPRFIFLRREVCLVQKENKCEISIRL